MPDAERRECLALVGLTDRALEINRRAAEIAREAAGQFAGDGRDRFGRTLARLFTEDGDVGEILINERLALRYLPGRRSERTAHWCGGSR